MLEDEFGDIIKKASRGLGKKINTDNVEEIARELNLKFKALKNIKEGKYKPKTFDYSKKYEGLSVAKISSTFMGGEVNAYIIIDENKNCVIIDTAKSPDKIIEFIKKEKLNPVFLLMTHEHQDHIDGADEIWEEFGTNNLDFEDLKDCPIINFGKRGIEIIKTQCHSEESLVYKVGKFLFVGDEIFAGSIGNSGALYQEHLKTIREKILSLDDDIIIFPGHGPITSVKEEKEHNPFF